MSSRRNLAVFLGSTGLLVALSGASLAACTSGISVIQVSGNGDGGPVDNDGSTPLDDAAPAEDAAPPPTDAPTGATNPYGVPYPTQNIGTKVRVGNTPGSVLANLEFTGYIPAATSTSSIQLADLFDPQSKTHDIVALVLGSGWDAPGRNMMTQLQAGMPARVALVSILGEGTAPGQAATLSDLSSWRTAIALPAAWIVLNPSFSQFSAPLYDHTAVPAVIILDARTMEIVGSEVGALSSPKANLESLRDGVKARPPSY